MIPGKWRIIRIHKRRGAYYAQVFNEAPEEINGVTQLSDYVSIADLPNYGIAIPDTKTTEVPIILKRTAQKAEQLNLLSDIEQS